MSPSPKLTEAEKQNGKRKLLIPSEEIQELMEPITQDDFSRIVKRTIPDSAPHKQSEEKKTETIYLSHHAMD